MLENHIHIIAKSEDMSRDIARFKAYTAKKILAYLIERNAKTILDQLKYYKISYKGKDREIQFWQEGVHPQMICDEIMMCQKVDYIHQNPVKRGFVDETVHWRYSSARNYLGYVGLLDVCTDWVVQQVILNKIGLLRFIIYNKNMQDNGCLKVQVA